MNRSAYQYVIVMVAALVASGLDSFPTEPASALFSASVHKMFHVSLKTILHASMPEHREIRALAARENAHLSAGYAYIAFSNDPSDKTCQKSSITVGIPVNTCTAMKDSSYKVVIVADSCEDATIQYFADTACTTLVKEKRLDTSDYTGCHSFDGDRTVEVSEGVTVTLPVHYWKLHCTAQPTKPIPVQSSVLDLFAGADACGDSPVGFVSIAQDVCFPVNDGQYSLAPRCTAGTDTVTLVASRNGVCGRPSFPNPLAGTCALVSDGLPLQARASARGYSSLHKGGGKSGRGKPGDKSEDGDEEEDGHHSRDDDHDHDGGDQDSKDQDDSGDDSRDGPSHDDDEAALPVLGLPAVTSYLVSCAAPNTDYTALVSVTQVIEATGDLYAGYLQDPALYSAVLQRAVAAAINLPGVTAEQVHITSVTAVDPLRQQSHAAPAAPVAEAAVSALATSALQLQYTVLAYSADLTGESVAEALKSAVPSGAFAAALRQIAQAEGVPSLADATSSEANVSALSSGSDGSSNKDGDEGDGSDGKGGLSIGAIVGIAGAALVGAVLLAALLLRSCYNGGSAEEKRDYHDLLELTPSAPAAVPQPVAAAAVVDGGSHRGVQTAVAVPVFSATAPPAQGGGKGTRAVEPVALHAQAYQV